MSWHDGILHSPSHDGRHLHSQSLHMSSIGHTISWPDERRRDVIRHKHQTLLQQSVEWFSQWGLLLSSSIISAILATSIETCANLFQSLRTGHCADVWYVPKSICCMGFADERCQDWVFWRPLVIVYITLTCVLAFLSALVVWFSPQTFMSGIPELKAYFEGYEMPGFLGQGPFIVKTIGLALSLSSGLWIGLEGPLVHLCCLCTNSLAPFFLGYSLSEAMKRDLLLAAAASGVCLSFNAPIGGLLFAFEVFGITEKNVLWRGFVCAMVSSVVYEAEDPMRTGKLIMYQVSYDRVWHAVELFFFAFLGVACGLLGTLLTRLNLSFHSWRDRRLSWCSPLIQVAVVALITAILTYPVDFLAYMTPEDWLHALFQECKFTTIHGFCGKDSTKIALKLAYSVLVSCFLIPITYGLPIPAGIILPCLMTGGLLGRLYGMAVKNLANEWERLLSTSFCPADKDCITPGVYALVGAAAMLTGTTKITVTSVVLVCEMTGALSYVVPIMTGVMVSKWVSDSLGAGGIYDLWVQRSKYPLQKLRGGHPIPNLTGVDILKPVAKLHIAHTSDSVAQLKGLLKENVHGFPVLENNTLIGYVTRLQLERALPEDSAEQFELRDILDSFEMHCLSSHASLLTISNYLRNLKVHTLLLVDKGELQGLVTQQDLWRLLTNTKGIPLLRREVSYRQSLERELPDL